MRKNSCRKRVINTRNGLDNSVVNCNTVTTFKTHICRLCHNYTEYRAVLELETNVNFDYVTVRQLGVIWLKPVFIPMAPPLSV